MKNIKKIIKEIDEKYQRVVEGAGFDKSLHRIVAKAKKFIPTRRARSKKFQRVGMHLDQILDSEEREHSSTISRHASANFQQCPECHDTMVILDSSKSELQCPSCGTVEQLIGTAFEDSQFYGQEGQKAKSGTCFASYFQVRDLFFDVNRLRPISVSVMIFTILSESSDVLYLE